MLPCKLQSQHNNRFLDWANHRLRSGEAVFDHIFDHIGVWSRRRQPRREFQRAAFLEQNVPKSSQKGQKKVPSVFWNQDAASLILTIRIKKFLQRRDSNKSIQQSGRLLVVASLDDGETSSFQHRNWQRISFILQILNCQIIIEPKRLYPPHQFHLQKYISYICNVFLQLPESSFSILNPVFCDGIAVAVFLFLPNQHLHFSCLIWYNLSRIYANTKPRTNSL